VASKALSVIASVETVLADFRTIRTADDVLHSCPAIAAFFGIVGFACGQIDRLTFLQCED
jgi:hypothetical protein